MGEHEREAAKSQLKLADGYFREGAHDKAIAEYLKVLNDYPETDQSQAALGSLAQSYAAKDDLLMVKMVSGYLAERFAGKQDAAVARPHLETGLAREGAVFYKRHRQAVRRGVQRQADHGPHPLRRRAMSL